MNALTKVDEFGKEIVIGLPKGSLQGPTFEIFKKAGYRISVDERSYFPSINDPEIKCVLMKAQEIATYTSEGILDIGITGLDWVKETNADVEVIEKLGYARQSRGTVKWVLAVANDSPIKSVRDLEGKRIATEAVNITREYLKKNGVDAKVEFSWGATEIKARGLVDAIVDVVETGSSLKANNLRIVDVIMESDTVLVANRKSLNGPWKKRKIEEIKLLLKSVLLAESKVLMMMNVRKKDLEKVLKILPAMNTPTISELSDKNWCDVITVLDKYLSRNLIPQLKEAGAEGILEIPITRIVN